MNNQMLSFEDALHQLVSAAVPVYETETVTINEALGRVLACDIVSTIDVPPLDNAAMDGYAVRIADLAAGSVLEVSQRIVAGRIGDELKPGTIARIMTGAPVPLGADAVVMQEYCTVTGAAVSMSHLPQPGEHIRRRGDDIATGDTVLSRGTRLDAASLGVAASIGNAYLPVYRRLRAALFSTGDELTMPGDPLKPGGIYNSNRSTLYSLLYGLGCAVSDFGIVPDDLESTRTMLRDAALKHDLILTSGGVSVGEEDYVKQAVTAEGELALWKLAIKPGKPLAFGRIRSVGADETPLVTGTAFIGLPGNPVASFVTFLTLVRPFILRAQAAEVTAPQAVSLRADFSWPGDKRREFLRVRRNDSGGVNLFPNQGSGVLTSCAWADGLVSNPPGGSIAEGDQVMFLAFSELM